MAEMRVAHTAELGIGELRVIRAMLDDAFADSVEGDFSDADWDHTLGGIHALVWEGEELIGHGAVVLRRLLHRGRALRTGYVESVAVRADRRGQGHGTAVMATLERIARRAYELGALGAAEAAAAFYQARGWQPWQGPTFVLAPSGIERTEDEDGWIYVLPMSGTPLDLSGDLVCDWRDGDVW